MSRLKLFLPLAVFALVAVFFYTMISRINSGEYDPKSMPSALINKPFPEFQLVQLEKPQTTRTREDLLGQIVLVNVWGTWCPSCHVEHPFLNYLADKKGIAIVGVNYKDKVLAAGRWLEQKGNPYLFNLFDPKGTLGLDLGVTGAPETYVVDHRGFVRLRFQGALNETVWQERFQPLLDQLREEQSAQGGLG